MVQKPPHKCFSVCIFEKEKTIGKQTLAFDAPRIRSFIWTLRTQASFVVKKEAGICEQAYFENGPDF
jgi:hypothetical protein